MPLNLFGTPGQGGSTTGGGLLGGVGSTLGGILDPIISVTDPVVDAVTDVVNGVISTPTGTTPIIDTVGTVVDVVEGVTETVTEPVTGVVDDLLGGILDFIPAVDVDGILGGLDIQDVLSVNLDIGGPSLANVAIGLNAADFLLPGGIRIGGILGTEDADIVRLSAGSEVGRIVFGSGNDQLISPDLAIVTGEILGGAGDDEIGIGIGDANVRGEEGNDRLTAIGTGNNYFNGGEGADYMAAGRGDDMYNVDNVGDQVVERANEGYDRVLAYIDYTLTDNVERLQMYGTAIDGTGNALDNVIIGNSRANHLLGLAGDDQINGGAGADTMEGGTGDDVYTVDNVGDRVIEGIGGGQDRVAASVNFTLDSNIERLDLTGGVAVSGTGNSLNNQIGGNAIANTLYGLAGDDVINGLGGADTMYGGTGNDNYIVNTAGDVVVELAGEGTNDRITSSVAYTLGDNVESLTLSGTASFNGTGNELNNGLRGNAGGNVLSGLAGNDVINGDAGNDRLVGGTGHDNLTGGLGRDTFAFADGDFGGKTATSADRITDFSHAQVDKIDLSAVDANTAVAGDQAFSFVGTAAFTGAGQIHLETVGGVTMLTGNTGGDLTADFAIRLDNVTTLVAADFVL